MDLKKSLQNQKGFTLIELLVVIVIIGILATGAMSVFNSAQAKARDAQRISDLEALKSAAEQYYTDNSEYPVGDDFAEFKSSVEPYLNKFPVDPKNGQGEGEEQFVYTYHVWDSAAGVSNQVYALSGHFESDSNYKKHNVGSDVGTQKGRYAIGSNPTVITFDGSLDPECEDTVCGDGPSGYDSKSEGEWDPSSED